ncbi:MAG TPA: OsmC family protein [Candidatus Limnocylindria bacterium]|jgi:hypothetical protein|nr:OsmC family protein [Candidatus Limnocylindria bacterium]
MDPRGSADRETNSGLLGPARLLEGVGDAIGVEGADDRIEPIEAALLGLSSCVTEAIVLNCARTGVKLDGLEVKAHADVDPGPITGVKDASDWDNTFKRITVDITARGDFSGRRPQDDRGRCDTVAGSLRVQQDGAAQDEFPLRVEFLAAQLGAEPLPGARRAVADSNGGRTMRRPPPARLVGQLMRRSAIRQGASA